MRQSAQPESDGGNFLMMRLLAARDSDGRVGVALAQPPGDMRRITLDSGYTVIEILMVLGLTGVISAMALPMTGNAVAYFRVSGSARSVSNAAKLTEMRAASTFNRARLYVNLSTRAFNLQAYDKAAAAWVDDQGPTNLPAGISFSFGSTSTAPPNTQGTIAQAPACLDAGGTAIANTACIVFNSRGIPIDSAGAPTGIDALYLTDGTSVYGVTVSATGLVRTWRTWGGGTWTKQ